jgi:hypothetical protein
LIREVDLDDASEKHWSISGALHSFVEPAKYFKWRFIKTEQLTFPLAATGKCLGRAKLVAGM